MLDYAMLVTVRLSVFEQMFLFITPGLYGPMRLFLVADTQWSDAVPLRILQPTLQTQEESGPPY
jgi:hypothetical protein